MFVILTAVGSILKENFRCKSNFHTITCSTLYSLKYLNIFFQTKMETLQVFIKTEEEDEKEDVAAQYLLPEETPCKEPVKSEW
jgi:hypothetical protein